MLFENLGDHITRLELPEYRKKRNESVGTTTFALLYVVRNEANILHFV